MIMPREGMTQVEAMMQFDGDDYVDDFPEDDMQNIGAPIPSTPTADELHRTAAPGVPAPALGRAEWAVTTDNAELETNMAALRAAFSSMSTLYRHGVNPTLRHTGSSAANTLPTLLFEDKYGVDVGIHQAEAGLWLPRVLKRLVMETSIKSEKMFDKALLVSAGERTDFYNGRFDHMAIKTVLARGMGAELGPHQLAPAPGAAHAVTSPMPYNFPDEVDIMFTGRLKIVDGYTLSAGYEREMQNDIIKTFGRDLLERSSKNLYQRDGGNDGLFQEGSHFDDTPSNDAIRPRPSNAHINVADPNLLDNNNSCLRKVLWGPFDGDRAGPKKISFTLEARAACTAAVWETFIRGIDDHARLDPAPAAAVAGAPAPVPIAVQHLRKMRLAMKACAKLHQLRNLAVIRASASRRGANSLQTRISEGGELSVDGGGAQQAKYLTLMPIRPNEGPGQQGQRTVTPAVAGPFFVGDFVGLGRGVQMQDVESARPYAAAGVANASELQSRNAWLTEVRVPNGIPNGFESVPKAYMPTWSYTNGFGIEIAPPASTHVTAQAPPSVPHDAYADAEANAQVRANDAYNRLSPGLRLPNQGYEQVTGYANAPTSLGPAEICKALNMVVGGSHSLQESRKQFEFLDLVSSEGSSADGGLAGAFAKQGFGRQEERERRGAVWDDAIRELAIANDHLYAFLRTMSGVCQRHSQTLTQCSLM
tara:strand:+ start:170 stop:2284 length:2115 start_codon:yes stop_codon:yes gene_type:complete